MLNLSPDILEPKVKPKVKPKKTPLPNEWEIDKPKITPRPKAIKQ